MIDDKKMPTGLIIGLVFVGVIVFIGLCLAIKYISVNIRFLKFSGRMKSCRKGDSFEQVKNKIKPFELASTRIINKDDKTISTYKCICSSRFFFNSGFDEWECVFENGILISAKQIRLQRTKRYYTYR